jgi:hypothetical protein
VSQALKSGSSGRSTTASNPRRRFDALMDRQLIALVVLNDRAPNLAQSLPAALLLFAGYGFGHESAIVGIVCHSNDVLRPAPDSSSIDEPGCGALSRLRQALLCVRLSPDECFALSLDDAISTRATNDDLNDQGISDDEIERGVHR